MLDAFLCLHPLANQLNCPLMKIVTFYIQMRRLAVPLISLSSISQHWDKTGWENKCWKSWGWCLWPGGWSGTQSKEWWMGQTKMLSRGIKPESRYVGKGSRYICKIRGQKKNVRAEFGGYSLFPIIYWTIVMVRTTLGKNWAVDSQHLCSHGNNSLVEHIGSTIHKENIVFRVMITEW